MSLATVGDYQQDYSRWEMSPAQILLFLALAASLTGRVRCQDEEDTDQTDEPVPIQETSATEETPPETIPSETPEDVDTESSGSADPAFQDDTGEDPTSTDMQPGDDLSPTIIIFPLVAVLVIICLVVVGVMISRRLRSKSASSDPVQHDAYLDACEGEKVPMPMFEDDVPSVLELEMEDLEKWMVKDGGGSNLNSGPV